MRIFDVPVGYFSEKTGRLLGDFIENFLEYDAKNNVSIWRDFMRVQVKMDVRYPLKRSKKIMILGGRAVKVKFRYEKLPIFCFICGRIGHMDKFCPKILKLTDETQELPRGWSTDLRVDLRRTVGGGDRRWLRDEQGGKVETEEEFGGNSEMARQLTSYGPDMAISNSKVILAHQEGNYSGKESLNNPVINGGTDFLEDSADLNLDHGE